MGIIRDVWVIAPGIILENVRLAYQLSDNYSVCAVRPGVMVSSIEARSARVETVLRYQQAEVARSTEVVQLKQARTISSWPFRSKRYPRGLRKHRICTT